MTSLMRKQIFDGNQFFLCDKNLIGQTEGSGMTSSKFDKSKGPRENGG